MFSSRHHATVSIIIEFFTAPDDASAAEVVDGGPESVFDTLTYGNFDVVSVLVEWESLLTGEDLDHARALDALKIVAQPDLDSRRMVFACPAALQSRLTSTDEAELADTATRWARQYGPDHGIIAPGPVLEVLGALAAMARSAASQRHTVYCWTG